MKKIRCLLFCMFSFLFFLPSGMSAKADRNSIYIGVLAKRSTEQCLQHWQPLADHLNRDIPLTFGEIENAVAEKRVDFVATNPAIYVALEKKYRATRIVTKESMLLGVPSSQFGGVLFTRKDRTDIRPAEVHSTIKNLSFKDIVPGMVAVEDVFAKNGTMLIPKDQEITWPVIQSLSNFEKHIGIIEPIRVRVAESAEEE